MIEVLRETGVIRRCACALLSLLAVCAPALAQKKDTPVAAPRSIAIVGGTLIDVRTGMRTRNSAILVRDNRIVKVGTVGDFAIPAQSFVVDAHDKWVLPGLADMHVHIHGEKRLPLDLFLANGVTTIRDVGGHITHQRLDRDAVASGERVGPRMFVCGNILDGMPPLGRGFIIADTPKRGDSAVNFLADQGVDCIKIYNSITEPVLAQIVKTANERNLPVIGHVPRALTMTQAVELGIQGLEHIRVTGRELLPVAVAERLDFLPLGQRETQLWSRFDLQSAQMKKLISLLVMSKVTLDPTLVVDEHVFVLSQEDQINHPNNRYLPSALRDEWRAYPVPKEFGIPADMKRMAADGFAKRKQFVGMCAKAGVRIVAGSDGAGLGTRLPGFALQHELELLVDAGLTPLQALQAATVNAAQALRREKDLGVIAEGYLADILILAGDPLQNIDNATRIELVIQDGRRYRPAQLLEALVQREH